jgi:hypothetical protein
MSVGPARLVLVPKTLGVSMSDVPARVAKRSSQPTRSTLSQRTSTSTDAQRRGHFRIALAKRASVPLTLGRAGELVEQRHYQPCNGGRTQ